MSVVVEIIPFGSQTAVGITARWRECAHTSCNYRACLQTPEWFKYRWESAACYLGVLSGTECEEPIAVTPLVQNRYQVAFSIGSRSLGAIHFNGVLLSGNVPLFPAQHDYYNKLFDSVFALPKVQCLYMLGVPKSSPFWDFLIGLQNERRDILFYTPGHESNRYFYIAMPESHEEYLSKFKAKTVQTFRRKLRLLEKAANARIELEKIDKASQVAYFLNAARIVSEKSWQRWLVGIDIDQSAGRQALLESFAEQGILRCYLLKSEGQDFAFAICFQLNGVVYFQSTAYDPKWAQFSPGQCLLYLVIKDCFECNRPKIFHFGTGDAHYKELFSNRSGDEVTLMVLKRNFVNSAKILGHQTFRKAVGSIKSMFGRK